MPKFKISLVKRGVLYVEADDADEAENIALDTDEGEIEWDEESTEIDEIEDSEDSQEED